MKLISFNVNSVRQRGHQLAALVESHHPFVIGLQETKVTDDEFPVGEIESLGYKPYFFGQKTHYGVALLAKQEPVLVRKGFPEDDDTAQRRFIHAAFEMDGGEVLHVLNGYFPQGEANSHPVKYPAKQKYYRDLIDYINHEFTVSDNVVVMGDLNIAFEDNDIGIGPDNAKRWLKTGKCSFLPEEREWFSELMQFGFVDTFRQHHADANDRFSWFDYRSKGFEREPRRGLRIDYILATPSLAEKTTDAGIDYAIRAMPKPSDHCPVWTEFALG